MTQTSPYLTEIHAALPRVLALFDTNPISTFRGVGDRYRWAWKGSDFANGTFQGAAHGLAVLIKHNLLPAHLNEAKILSRVYDMIDGIRAITHANGSLDEILPLESSYCVTALVAFDALCALDALQDKITPVERERHIKTIAPLIGFLTRSHESHGIITNHLAVAVAALARWQKLTGEDVKSTRDAVMQIIWKHYSEEGWFKEYDGADPGYQTLALDYLVDVAANAPDIDLHDALGKTSTLLSYCIHPDGSFGGLYGSRNTRFLYPAGIEHLAQTSRNAAAFVPLMRKAHVERTVVGLAAMDDSNLIPMFNSFCRAAALAGQTHAEPGTVGHAADTFFQQHFEAAGWIVTKNAQGYSIINWRKGTVSHFSPNGTIIDGGTRAVSGKGHWFTSQTAGAATKLVSTDVSKVVIQLPVLRYHVSHPTPLQMVVLRLLCVSVMRIPILNALIKKMLVWLLISRKATSGNIVQRTIHLQPQLRIEDAWVANPDGLKLHPAPSAFHAVHMASAGYWQRGDDV